MQVMLLTGFLIPTGITFSFLLYSVLNDTLNMRKQPFFKKSEQILNVFRILGARERGKIRKYHGGKWTLTTNSRLHNTWRQR